jgi:response regulator RpfG family c-di-GMP phosphodiesterase
MSQNDTPAPLFDSSLPFIMVVEDDSIFRRLLARTLKRHGFNVRELENGLAAKTVFELCQNEVQLVISDIRMPQFDGVELLKFVRGRSSVPFIVITGFSEIVEAKTAHELGANDFISKPFPADELIDVVNRCLFPQADMPEKDSALVEKPKEKYCAIHISEFLTSSQLRSDIYISLSKDKYIKVARKGDEISLERLKTYEEKKVDYLYVTLTDFADYVNFSAGLTSAVSKSKALNIERKTKLFRHTSEILLARCFLESIEPELVQPAKKMVEDVLELVSKNDDTLELFANLEANANRLYAQGVAGAVYASLVAKLHGWNSGTSQFKIIMAALLRDIGLREIDADILYKKRLDRTPEEVHLIESHPVRGRDIVAQMKSMPEDIATIVYQHHENPLGTGFPMGLKSEGIHPIAKLIGTVDRFVSIMLPMEAGSAQVEPRDALLRMNYRSSDEFDQAFYIRLLELFKVDLEEAKRAA